MLCCIIDSQNSAGKVSYPKKEKSAKSKRGWNQWIRTSNSNFRLETESKFGPYVRVEEN